MCSRHIPHTQSIGMRNAVGKQGWDRSTKSPKTKSISSNILKLKWHWWRVLMHIYHSHHDCPSKSKVISNLALQLILFVFFCISIFYMQNIYYIHYMVNTRKITRTQNKNILRYIHNIIHNSHMQLRKKPKPTHL